jgi:hypothetical protein
MTRSTLLAAVTSGPSVSRDATASAVIVRLASSDRGGWPRATRRPCRGAERGTGDDTATGIWAIFDWIDDPGRGGAWQGFGHYHEQCVRGPDGQWRIREVHLTRLRMDKIEPREPIQHVSINDSQLERSCHPADT